MKRLLDWFSRHSQQKLRVSQIKIIYQNRLALEFLQDTFKVAQSAGFSNDPELLAGLADFELCLGDAILELSWKTILPENRSAELFQMNRALRNLYSGVMEGKRRARSMTGGDSTGIEKFENRFAPAAGWSKFSEREFDLLLRKADARQP